MARQRRKGPRQSQVVAFGLIAGFAFFSLVSCSSAKSPAGLVTQDVRVFVDMNGNAHWDEGDVALPEIRVLLDGQVQQAAGSDGIARFEEQSPGQHRVELEPADAQFLEESGLVLAVKQISIEIPTEDAVEYALLKHGFLEVDVERQSNGQGG